MRTCPSKAKKSRTEGGVGTGAGAGVSSGAIASIAVRIANEMDEGNVVFIVCDDGWKYLSSGIYTLPVDEIANMDSTVWW